MSEFMIFTNGGYLSFGMVKIWRFWLSNVK